MTPALRTAALLCSLLLAAYGQDPAASSSSEQNSRALQPADAALAEIYNRSCRNCHTIAATGAPLTGDNVAWAARMELGMETMLNSVINGSGGMPPFGLCMDCDPEQFEALISFMAAPAAK